MRTKTHNSLVDQQNAKIRQGAHTVQKSLDMTEEDLYWVMIDLGIDYARKRYPISAERLIACPLYWKEFVLWWHTNNHRFLSEMTVDDLTWNGTEWARQQYAECQLRWCLELYTPSKVVKEEALVTDRKRGV